MHVTKRNRAHFIELYMPQKNKILKNLKSKTIRELALDVESGNSFLTVIV